MWQEDVPAIIARRDVMEQSDMSLTTLKSAPIVPIENIITINQLNYALLLHYPCIPFHLANIAYSTSMHRSIDFSE